jgi:hypothetical protein
MNSQNHRQKKWIGGWNFNSSQICDVVDHVWSVGSQADSSPPRRTQMWHIGAADECTHVGAHAVYGGRCGVKTKAPQLEEWGLVAGVTDPSGVLWRFAEIPAQNSD